MLKRFPTLANISHDPFLSYIYSKVHNNNGCCNVLIVGDTGTGKSWLTLAIGVNVDKRFNGSPSWDLPSFIQSIVDTKYKGQFNFFEEVGTTNNLQSRNFQSSQNKLGSSAFQILRFTNGINVLTVPSNIFVDKQVRQLMHIIIEVSHHDNKFTYAKVYFLKNTLKDEVLTMYPRYKDKTGMWYVADEVVFYKPPKEITEIYEAEMDATKKKWLMEYIEKLKKPKKEEIEANKEAMLLSRQEIINLISLNKEGLCFAEGKKEGLYDYHVVLDYIEEQGLQVNKTRLYQLIKTVNNKLVRERNKTAF